MVFDLYLPPCDWQRPSLLKFFRSWRVQWDKATHQCQWIQPSQNAKKQYQRIQYSQILIHRENISAACDWWLGLTQRRVITHCMWLLTIPPATLEVIKSIWYVFYCFFSILKPTTILSSRLISHALTLNLLSIIVYPHSSSDELPMS